MRYALAARLTSVQVGRKERINELESTYGARHCHHVYGSNPTQWLFPMLYLRIVRLLFAAFMWYSFYGLVFSWDVFTMKAFLSLCLTTVTVDNTQTDACDASQPFAHTLAFCFFRRFH